ncbi:MAG TPA: response regulator transcription factor [Solirubrobacteraceae bacterium]
MSVRVLLADDQELMRMGFRMVIESQSDLEIVGEAGNGREALEAASELKPDIVLMDVRMPELDGIEATRRIVAGDDRIRIIVLTTFDLDEYAYAALRAGASGFLLKDAPPAELLAAIRAVASGDAVIAPSVTRRLLAKFMRHLPDPAAPQPPGNPGLAQLTPREREVLIEVARSHSNAEVAERLVLSEATVKTHVGRILAKLSLRDRVQIVVFAYENGLIRPAIDTWGGGALDAPDGRALDVRSARAADARDGDAVDTVGGEAADRRGGEAADRRGGEAVETVGGEDA